jgi:hypothetical protein
VQISEYGPRPLAVLSLVAPTFVKLSPHSKHDLPIITRWDLLAPCCNSSCKSMLQAARCKMSCFQRSPHRTSLQGQEKAPAAAPLISFSPGASVARVYLICVAMLCFHNRRSVGVHCGPGIVVTSLNIIRQTLYYESGYITTYLIKTFWYN